METNNIRITAIDFAKFCIKSIGLEVADGTLQNDFDKFIAKQKLPIHSVSGKRPIDDVIAALELWQTFDARIHTGLDAANFHFRGMVALQNYQAACASGAVDKTVSEVCECEEDWGHDAELKCFKCGKLYRD